MTCSATVPSGVLRSIAQFAQQAESFFFGDFCNDIVAQALQGHAQEQGSFRTFIEKHDFHAVTPRKMRTRKGRIGIAIYL